MSRNLEGGFWWDGVFYFTKIERKVEIEDVSQFILELGMNVLGIATV